MGCQNLVGVYKRNTYTHTYKSTLRYFRQKYYEKKVGFILNISLLVFPCAKVRYESSAHTTICAMEIFI